MRVAVTGAAGYLGRLLVDALASDERIERVVGLDVRPVPARPGAQAIVRDVRDPALERDLRGADALVHLAFMVLGSGRGAASVNIDGSRNAFECALRAGVPAILHASSAAAYGCTPENPVPLGEDRPLRGEPPFYYPRDKAAVERLLDGIEEREPGMRAVRLRPVGVVGPGAPRPLGGRAWVGLSDFDPLVQVLWADDLVALALAALFEPVRGAFNAGAPGPVRASEVAGLLGVRSLRASHRTVRGAAAAAHRLRLPGALHPGWVDMVRYPIVVSTERAERELGFAPTCDCSEALRRFGALRLEEAA